MTAQPFPMTEHLIQRLAWLSAFYLGKNTAEIARDANVRECEVYAQISRREGFIEDAILETKRQLMGEA